MQNKGYFLLIFFQITANYFNAAEIPNETCFSKFGLFR